MDIDRFLDAIIDSEDLVKNKGGKLLYTVEREGHDDWYLVFTNDADKYYDEGDDDDDEPYAEILLVKGDAFGWEIDCSFNGNLNDGQKTLDYLLKKYDKWELMRMFDYDGMFSGLNNHIASRFDFLKDIT